MRRRATPAGVLALVGGDHVLDRDTGDRLAHDVEREILRAPEAHAALHALLEAFGEAALFMVTSVRRQSSVGVSI
jgi:hypothetical protein